MMKPTVSFTILQTCLKKVKLYILMEPTEKLAAIQIYHLTGNALKLNTESGPDRYPLLCPHQRFVYSSFV
jgi:hypothetical protein